ncbi:MAG: aminotransferase class V-fold PLP-dependent enzyme [Chitinophagales bacterium]|nr:aminotransferase class V-fold PLP-dependent enzyme [Chitinophagales bacterium]
MPLITAEPAIKHFENFRKHIIGLDFEFDGPYGKKKLLYADWIASGRLYQPIEEKIMNGFGPVLGNTHTETNFTGTSMTLAYQEAKKRIKAHVNASNNDALLSVGSGMTGAVTKLQRLLGLKIPEQWVPFLHAPPELKPVVFITHMEHHSNQTSWEESYCDVVIVPPDEEGMVDISLFEEAVQRHNHRPIKYAAITACSNVTGIETPYYQIAEVIHRHGGWCFVDFACSAPYVSINMHPENPLQQLDAIYFSPHKFLGGPGTPGILIFNEAIYHNRVPDQPGGGTVKWTNPWGGHSFLDSIEDREDGGTPAFLQTIKAALCMDLKLQMDPKAMSAREAIITERICNALSAIPHLHILASHIRKRLGVISFYIDAVHYNLVVKLLNDLYGIQVRGGCSCAGTYGHYLLHVSPDVSKRITDKIDHGDFSEKPGWVRLSLHPVMSDEEIDYIIAAIEKIATGTAKWESDYTYDHHTNEYHHRRESPGKRKAEIEQLFNS